MVMLYVRNKFTAVLFFEIWDKNVIFEIIE